MYRMYKSPVHVMKLQFAVDWILKATRDSIHKKIFLSFEICFRWHQHTLKFPAIICISEIFQLRSVGARKRADKDRWRTISGLEWKSKVFTSSASTVRAINSARWSTRVFDDDSLESAIGKDFAQFSWIFHTTRRAAESIFASVVDT